MDSVASYRLLAVLIVCVFALLAAPTKAQKGGGEHLNDNSGLNGSLSRSDLEKLNGQKQDKASQTPAARAKAKAQAAKLLASLRVSCDISDAQLVLSGTRKSDSGGRQIDTQVYEVACGGKMGYLLETQGPEKVVGISCLSAEEARAVDVDKGRQPGFFCKLAENKDVNALVSSLIASSAGSQCKVQRLQYFGKSESTQTEYSEVACTDGQGYLVRIALPGSTAPTLVYGCQDAAKQGLKCKMTAPAPAPEAAATDDGVTMDTLKAGLVKNGVSCSIGPMRLIGQEDHRKRYVVEYRCTDQPTGNVAFIPLEGNSQPYESLNCAEAVTQGIPCMLAASK